MMAAAMKIALFTRDDLPEDDPTRVRVRDILKSLGCDVVQRHRLHLEFA